MSENRTLPDFENAKKRPLFKNFKATLDRFITKFKNKHDRFKTGFKIAVRTDI